MFYSKSNLTTKFYDKSDIKSKIFHTLYAINNYFDHGHKITQTEKP